MSLLREELLKSERIGDILWLISKFKDVAQQYAEFHRRTEAAETLRLWSQRMLKSMAQCTSETQISSVHISLATIEPDFDVTLHLMIDRWTSGDPSYLLAMRKALQNLLIMQLRERLEKLVPALVEHAANYARDDPRLAFSCLDAMARSNASVRTMVKKSLPTEFFASAFSILVHDPSRSSLVGKFLVATLPTESDADSWLKYARPHLDNINNYQTVMTYFVGPMLKASSQPKQTFQQLMSLFDADMPPFIEIGLLKAAKNASIDVSSLIISSSSIKECLASNSVDLRFESLTLLCCCTCRLTDRVPIHVMMAIKDNWDHLAAESLPKLRADVYSALRNLLIRINTSKDVESATPFISFLGTWCGDQLLPGMPYRYLAMSTRLLGLLVQYGFQDLVLTPQVARSLINCTTSNFEDIRESCVELVRKISPLPQLEQNSDSLVEQALKLTGAGNSGETGARLLQLLDQCIPEASVGDLVYQRLGSRLRELRGNIRNVESGESIYGYLLALRLTKPQNTKLMPLVLDIWRLCSPPLTSIAPEGIDDNITNFCWKALKESSLLAESLALEKGDTMSREFTNEFVVTLLEQLSSMLTSVTHRGAFAAIPPAYSAIARLNPEEAVSLVRMQVEELEARSKHRSVTRRSAGLPLLITSTLAITFDEEVVESLFRLATLPFVEGEMEELAMPQVHGMNCLKAIMTSAELAKPTKPIVERMLKLALERFNCSVWSLRNCAAMMFSTLFKRLFGVQEQPLPAVIFFQRYKQLQSLLYDQLAAAGKASDLQAVYPSLAILAKLQLVSSKDDSLSVYWEPVLELLGSPSWKIRELAARTVTSLTHESLIPDVIAELTKALDLRDSNELHGYAMALTNLARSRDSSADNDGLKLVRSRLEAIIARSECFEVSTELFKCWKLLGGRDRIISFDSLPRPRFLNPSIGTFEAEQVQISSSEVFHYSEGWSQVLRKLPSNKWTPELAIKVLESRTQMPDLQATCLQAMQTSTSAAQISDVALQLLGENFPYCVQQEALVCAAHCQAVREEHHAAKQWTASLVKFGRDDAPIESRHSAARGIAVYLSGSNALTSADLDSVLFTLLKLLSDEEEVVREICAETASDFLGFREVKVAEVCEAFLLERISPEFVADTLALDLEEACRRARRAFENPNTDLFLVERENSYRDEIRYIRLLASRCKSAKVHRDVASRAAEILKGLDFEVVLGPGAFLDLVEARERIDALTKAPHQKNYPFSIS